MNKKLYIVIKYALLLGTANLQAMEKSQREVDEFDKIIAMSDDNDQVQEQLVDFAMLIQANQKRKNKANKKSRPVKNLKTTLFSEEFEEEEPGYEIVENKQELDCWNSSPDEIQVYILSFVINTSNIQRLIVELDVQEISDVLKQYCKLNLLSKKIRSIALDKTIFDFDSIKASFIENYKLLNRAGALGCANIIMLRCKYAPDINHERCGDGGFFRVMVEASKNKHIKLCAKLIELGIFDGAHNAPLINAIYLHKCDVVETLIERKSTVASLDDDDYNELMMAAEVGNIEIFKLLLKANPKHINKGNDHFPLAVAAEEGHIEILQILLDNEVDVNTERGEGFTALEFAAEHGQLESVKFLINNGAIIDIVDGDNYTALTYAVKGGYTEVCKFLLEKGATANVLNNGNGWSALIWAATISGDRVDIAELLLSNGADINYSASTGMTALKAAILCDNISVAKLLISKGAITNFEYDYDKLLINAIELAI